MVYLLIALWFSMAMLVITRWYMWLDGDVACDLSEMKWWLDGMAIGSPCNPLGTNVVNWKITMFTRETMFFMICFYGPSIPYSYCMSNNQRVPASQKDQPPLTGHVPLQIAGQTGSAILPWSYAPVGWRTHPKCLGRVLRLKPIFVRTLNLTKVDSVSEYPLVN